MGRSQINFLSKIINYTNAACLNHVHSVSELPPYTADFHPVLVNLGGAKPLLVEENVDFLRKSVIINTAIRVIREVMLWQEPKGPKI